jgi:dolichyl-phosphate-mannose-protein mannosyltransferase
VPLPASAAGRTWRAVRGDAAPPRAPRGVLIALGLLLVAGLLLRAYLVWVWRPGFTGFPDTNAYLYDAFLKPFWDPLRVVGYGYFLHWTHAIKPNLSATILLQHLLGIASALLGYATVRRLGAPAVVALAPAAAVLLGAQELFLEHAVLSEAVFLPLIAGALYCAARTLDGRAWPWALLAGVCVGLVACVRLAGAFVLPAIVLWLLVHGRGGWRPRVLTALAAILGAVVALTPYVVARHDATGTWGMSTSGGWNLYARAATFADCTKFTPPEGTRVLCETTPPSKRLSPSYYAFGASPARRAFGGNAQFPPPPDKIAKVRAFAVAAIEGQPGAYLVTVGKNLWRFVDPAAYPEQSGNSPQSLVDALVSGGTDQQVLPVLASEYGISAPLHKPGISHLLAYERHTRVQGVVVVVLLALALIAAVLARGRARAGVDLLWLVLLALVLAPVLTVFYDARYAVPVLPPLFALAGFGAWLGWELLRRRRAAYRPDMSRTAAPMPSPPDSTGST